KDDLEGVIKPKPNKEFLGWKYKLSFYNLIDTPKTEKGLRQWMRRTFAEPPVLGSSFDAESNRELMENVMQNRGFFRSKVFAEEQSDSLYTSGLFNVNTREQAFIDSVEFLQNSTLLSREMVKSSDQTLLKKGQPYNLELIKGERERIDKHLKEKGYYFFLPNY